MILSISGSTQVINDRFDDLDACSAMENNISNNIESMNNNEDYVVQSQCYPQSSN